MKSAVADGSPQEGKVGKDEVQARQEEGETVGKIGGPENKIRCWVHMGASYSSAGCLRTVYI